jgi:hypothetical protein
MLFSMAGKKDYSLLLFLVSRTRFPDAVPVAAVIPGTPQAYYLLTDLARVNTGGLMLHA